MLFPNWSLCKKRVIFTNLFFYSGNCTRSDQVQCPGSSKCIPTRYLCDGDNDCGDSSRSDEQGCRWLILFTFLVPVLCHEMGHYSFTFYWVKKLLTYDSFFSGYTFYRSRPRKCVNKYGICNGRDDCADGSDERQDFCGKWSKLRVNWITGFFLTLGIRANRRGGGWLGCHNLPPPAVNRVN